MSRREQSAQPSGDGALRTINSAQPSTEIATGNSIHPGLASIRLCLPLDPWAQREWCMVSGQREA